MQIGDHEIKFVNFAEDTTNFLRDITHRMQVILKLYEDVSRSKINFFKKIAIYAGGYKNRIDHQR